MTPNLNKSLALAQKEFKPVRFNCEAEVIMKSGGKYKFAYADLGAVLEASRDALAKNGLALTSTIDGNMLTVFLRHESGEAISSSLPIRLSERPQDLGSQLTFYRRYLISGLICVAAEDDDDAGKASGDETIVTKKEAKKPEVKKEKSEPKVEKVEEKKEPNVLQNFVIKFGPDKGKTFDELGSGEISKKIAQLKYSKADFAKTKMAKDFVLEAELWLKNGDKEVDSALDYALAKPDVKREEPPWPEDENPHITF